MSSMECGQSYRTVCLAAKSLSSSSGGFLSPRDVSWSTQVKGKTRYALRSPSCERRVALRFWAVVWRAPGTRPQSWGTPPLLPPGPLPFSAAIGHTRLLDMWRPT